MIKNGTELQKRVITGGLGAIVLLLLITLGGRVGVALFAAVIALAMVYEYAEMVLELPDRIEKRMVLLGTTWLLAFVNFWAPRNEYVLLLMIFLGLFTYFLFTADRHKGEAFSAHFHELVYSTFGMLYLAFLPLFLVLIRDSAGGAHWILIFLFIVWLGDTAAYFTGRKYGKRKLYPAVSPKKTVEGSIGGLVGGIAIVIAYKLAFFQEMPWGAAILTPIIVGLVSQVGDLCESFLKRAFDKKDSGSLLPGHGGFLDRFDSVVFSAPIMYGCIRIFS